MGSAPRMLSVTSVVEHLLRGCDERSVGRYRGRNQSWGELIEVYKSINADDIAIIATTEVGQGYRSFY